MRHLQGRGGVRRKGLGAGAGSVGSAQRAHLHRERHQRPAAVARVEPFDVHVEEVVIGQVDICGG